MTDQTFYLFRVTLHDKRQSDLYDKRTLRSDVLRQLLFSHPKAHGWGGKIWTVGNVEELPGASLYFRFGRASKRQLPVQDEKGDFLDADISIAPYSHCLIHLDLQILAMTYNGNLSQSIASQGKSLQTVLSSALRDFKNFDAIEVRQLPDPREFVKKIREAFSVSRFWIKVRRPNPFDVDSHFIKPISRLNDAVGGNEVKVGMSGDDLDKEVIENIATNTALQGSDGAAYVRPEKDTRGEIVPIKKTMLKFSMEFDQSREGKETVRKRISFLYENLLSPPRNE